MIFEESAKKLYTLPWQALYDLAVEKQIDGEEIKHKEKTEIIRRVLLSDITEAEIEAVIDDYTYGNRVTFTLWGFSKTLSVEDISALKALEQTEEDYIDVEGFRNLKYVSLKTCSDRLEMIYSYSKEYSFINEEGKADSVWEMHQGCLWIGTEKNYLASISKHEKMLTCVISLIEEKLRNTITQIKPPKKAIERCTNFRAMSRIVLQGTGGEKTAISNSSGFTEEQTREVERIQAGRFDTSGSYIAEINDETTATVKYNVSKGNLGIYKHLPSSVLFSWSKTAIEIILEEIENLKGRPAGEIFREMGVEIKWPGHASDFEELNWLLTQIISSLGEEAELRCTIPDSVKPLLQKEDLFFKIPRIYCNECESYELPYCAHCGEALTYNRKGVLECSCDAPLRVTCAEQHRSCEIKPWFLPKDRLVNAINKNILNVYKDHNLDYKMCIMGDELYIVHEKTGSNAEVELLFSDVSCFQYNASPDPNIRPFAVRMNEKCISGTCSFEKINRCLKDATMSCLPKVFYGILPSYRPQPHKGGEFGDVSGQIQVGNSYYQMIGIIKKNSENKSGRRSRERTTEELAEKPLLATAREGEEIIRQFVEQGMTDARVDAIAVIAPQYFDHGLKGTLKMLARLAGKKVLFIELDEICKLIAMNENVQVI